MALSGVYGAVEPGLAKATLHRALDTGIRLFDTAALYGDGANEELIGHTLGARLDVFVTTKFGLYVGGPGELIRNSRPQVIRRSVDASLKRLRRDRIDLLLQHRQDPNTPDEVVADVAARLLEEGKIGAFGLSASSPDRIDLFKPTVAVRALQNEFSLAVPGDYAVPVAAGESGAMFMAYAPLGRSILTGGAIVGRSAPGDLRATMKAFRRDNREETQRLVSVLAEIAGRHQTTPAAVALAWILSSGRSTVPLPGARSPAQVDAAIGAAGVELMQGDLSLLQEARATD
jgi:aryl-alcohol dehydrogenase-like predicted oxidoreductase